jgi:hypothetical protein
MDENLDARALPKFSQMGLNMCWSNIWGTGKGLADFSKRTSYEQVRQAPPVVTRRLRELRTPKTIRLFDRADRHRSFRSFA